MHDEGGVGCFCSIATSRRVPLSGEKESANHMEAAWFGVAGRSAFSSCRRRQRRGGRMNWMRTTHECSKCQALEEGTVSTLGVDLLFHYPVSPMCYSNQRIKFHVALPAHFTLLSTITTPWQHILPKTTAKRNEPA